MNYEDIKKKYDRDPKENMPRMVYGPPFGTMSDDQSQYKASIGYSIGGIGKTEMTILTGLTVGDEFRFGNGKGYKVKIINITRETVIFKFIHWPRNIKTPKTAEVKIDNLITFQSNITPDVTREIKVLEITKTKSLRVQ